MTISSLISSILVLAIGIWAYFKLEPTMTLFAERQLLIEPSKLSYKMWKDMPVNMYQSFTFFNLTNWNQVKSIGQKPKFVEVGPYVYKTVWTKSEIQFLNDDQQISFAERKKWYFQPSLSLGHEDDQIWTINTPLMTALALIQNAPVITRNIVSVILDGLGEGAFIKRPIKSLLFEGYPDLIVSVGPLFDRRFANFNGKFAYLYNKNDSIDGIWTVSTGKQDINALNKIIRYQSNVVNMSSVAHSQHPQGLNEVKAECFSAWDLDQATNGQLFPPFNMDQYSNKVQAKSKEEQQQQVKRNWPKSSASSMPQINSSTPVNSNLNQQHSTQSYPSPIGAGIAKRSSFFSRSSSNLLPQNHDNNIVTNNNKIQRDFNSQTNSQSPLESLIPSASSIFGHPTRATQQALVGDRNQNQNQNQNQDNDNTKQQQQQQVHVLFPDLSKFMFYPDLCRPMHLIASSDEISAENGIRARRFHIDPRVFMNSTQNPSNRCYEMNPKQPLANALAATINSVTGANVAMSNLNPIASGSSPFSMFSPGILHQDNSSPSQSGGIFERSNHQSSFLNNALSTLANGPAALASANSEGSHQNGPLARLGRVRQLFSNIVSQRMSSSANTQQPQLNLLPSLTSTNPSSLLMGSHSPFLPASSSSAQSRHDDNYSPGFPSATSFIRRASLFNPVFNSVESRQSQDPIHSQSSNEHQINTHNNQLNSNQNQNHVASHGLGPSQPHSDWWVTQFRFKWPKGVFSIGQCQLGAPIYVSLPHFLDADEYYLEQVDGLKPNRSLHEFYIDIESSVNSVPVGAKARLQLNVATPELRFRNIPNAMIPVLWQEVTFEIDKPVATMLYWSFTMSSTMYKLLSIIIVLTGLTLMTRSFVLCCRQKLSTQKRGRVGIEQDSSSSTNTGSSLSITSTDEHHKFATGRRSKRRRSSSLASDSSSVDHRSISKCRSVSGSESGRGSCSWQANDNKHHGGCRHHNCSMSHHQHHHQHDAANNGCQTTTNSDTLSLELRHGAALNHGFCLARTSQDNLHNNQHQLAAAVSQNMNSLTMASCSPKQPSSRASSHCELVHSSNNNLNDTLQKQQMKHHHNHYVTAQQQTAVNGLQYAGCLLACLRHAPVNQHSHQMQISNQDQNCNNINNNNNNNLAEANES